MTGVAWSDRYVTGIKAIDKDHHSLFELLASLVEHRKARSGPSAVAATLHALEVYAAEHFEREERFMLSAHFPGFETHRRAHDEFRTLVQALARQYRREPASIDLDKVSQFLAHWIGSHILVEDMAYVPYLNGTVSAEVDDTDTPPMPIEIVLRVPPGKHEVIKRFAALMRDGGEVADTLENTLNALEHHREQVLDHRVRALFGT
ncbi:bacteriohemerythrin [Pararhodospirillum oryzae]|nr:bacteriohemerythrin [Pararhodospirillum oryzae]